MSKEKLEQKLAKRLESKIITKDTCRIGMITGYTVTPTGDEKLPYKVQYLVLFKETPTMPQHLRRIDEDLVILLKDTNA